MDVDVLGIDINAGYTGTITQASGVGITVGTSGYNQAAGTFVGGGDNNDVDGAFALSGGFYVHFRQARVAWWLHHLRWLGQSGVTLDCDGRRVWGNE